jgi:YHS domain-containing protein
MANDRDRDPVSGVEVDRQTAIRVDHGDHVHYFASEETREQFLADPERYNDVHRGARPDDVRDGHARPNNDGRANASARPDDPPFTTDHSITAPKFGSAGSGGAEYEPLPPGVRD